MILRNPSRWRDSFFVACLLFLLTYSSLSFAQGVIGVVREADTRQLVANAIVSVIKGDSIIATLITDENGRYEYVSSAAGRVRIQISSLGYITQSPEDILLDGYSTFRIESFLETNIFSLEVVTITNARVFNPNVQKILAQELSLTAANFDDPVRVATSQPGIVQLNDQANHISVRRQNPLFNSWYLEGLEIANPNHTNNAGTFSDYPTQSGGGVNMFSAQALGSTDIYTGLNPLRIGRSAGAVIDMHLHETTKAERRAKAGLIGLEYGMGQAFGEKGMLDINLRYSFTGLLANLGVDFGGEKIGFTDAVASFRHLGTKHKLKIYAWGGNSRNEFNKIERPEQHEKYKDFFDIDFESFLAGIGIRYDYIFGPKLSLRCGGSGSGSATSYFRKGQFGALPVSLDLDDDVAVISSMAELEFTHSSRIQSIAGVNYTYRDFISFGPFRDESFLRPYISARIALSPAFKLEAGGEAYHSFLNNHTIPGYRAQLQWNDQNQSIYSGLRHAAGQSFTDASDVTRSIPVLIDKYELGWLVALKRNSLGVKIYYQEISNMPRYINQYGTFQLPDYADLIAGTYITTDNNGIGKYYGIEGEWKWSSKKGWNSAFNQSVFKSERGIEGEALSPGKFAGGFASHISIAKEVVREKKGKNRIWNFSVRGFFHGGIWEPAIDVGLSEIDERTTFVNPDVFNQQLPHYKRVDASVSRTIANTKIRWRYALDIQNVAGFSNVAYHYYDPFIQSIQSQEQLGIIPVLSIQASW